MTQRIPDFVLSALCLCVGVISLASCKQATPTSASHVSNRQDSDKKVNSFQSKDASDLLFDSGKISKIVLTLSKESEAKLNEDARRYVQCQMVQDGRIKLVDVGIKLKGAAGSFQDLSGKPAFTINVSKFRKKQSFHDLDKFHLNNSVQDSLYTNEWLCASICRDAGIPAPRVAHARVWLNDRDLGLYVLKEGFDRKFLGRHFKDPSGNLYDGGFCQDIDVDLEKDCGDGPNDLSDIRTLREACEEREPTLRAARVEKHLDIATFKTLLAFEMMTCHWDGYVANRNNYRVYFSPDSKRAHFLPHGMDQMFQDPNFQTFGATPSIVAAAFRSNPEWNTQFRNRVAELLPLFEGRRLATRIESLHVGLRAELQQMHAEGVAEFEQQTKELIERLQERYHNIAKQLTEPDPPMPEEDPTDPLVDDVFAVGEIRTGETVFVPDWHPKQETDSAMLERVDPIESQENSTTSTVVYTIEVGEENNCIASWRKTVYLPPGSYAFVAEIRVEKVVERTEDDRGRGAGLRISGERRENGLTADSDYAQTSFPFQVAEEQPSVQLVAELRATHGKMAMKNPRIIRNRQ